MDYPDEVKPFIAFLEEYKEDDGLQSCHIVHMYPRGLAYPNGYYDSQLFDLIAYNTRNMTKRNLGKHDGLAIGEGIEVDIIRIFADGSTMIRFYHDVEFDLFQAVYIKRCADLFREMP